MKKILILLLTLALFGCKTDKPISENIVMNFSRAANNVLLEDGNVLFVDSLGAGTVTVTLDSVFMDIPSDDIGFSFRKGPTMSTKKGTAIFSSNQESGIFLVLGFENQQYFCELNTGERLVQFDVESVDEK